MTDKNITIRKRQREPMTNTQLLMTITIGIFVVMYASAMVFLGGGFLKAETVCIGADFRFGKGRAGSAEDLIRIGNDAGFRTLTVNEVRAGDTVVSTSAIKELIRDGRIEEADIMLGYPYRIEGTVIHGNHLAAGMGFPTANLLIPKETVPPRRGVYLSRTSIDGASYKSITNIGTRPTVTEDTEPTAETR